VRNDEDVEWEGGAEENKKGRSCEDVQMRRGEAREGKKKA
jgi:hypothetical protein